MKKYVHIIIWAVILFLIFPGRSKAGPRFSIDQSSWDVGKLIDGKVLTNRITFTNQGTENLDITLRIGCPCLTLSSQELVVLSGREKEISVELDTTGLGESFVKKIYIQTNDPEFGYGEYIIEGGAYSDIELHYFYEPGCPSCEKVEQRFADLKDNDTFALIEYPIDKSENFEKFMDMKEKSEGESLRFPAIITAGRIYAGSDIFRLFDNLEEKIIPPPTLEEVEDTKTEEGRWALLPFLGAALVDGINPCAFGMIIMMVAYLSIHGKRSSKFILLSGMLYSAGVFIVYFLFGLGILAFLKRVPAMGNLQNIIYSVMGTLTLVLGILSFNDALAVGGKGKVFLKVPQSWRGWVIDKMGKFASSKNFLYLAFFLGAVVAAVEFICTGQIYLPALTYMVGTEVLRMRAVFYLFIYNLFFILPMVIIFLLIWWGMSSEEMENFYNKKLGLVKLIQGGMFLFFTVYLFWHVFY